MHCRFLWTKYDKFVERFILMVLITRICWVNKCFNVQIQQGCKIIHLRECIFCEFFYNHAYFFYTLSVMTKTRSKKCIKWQRVEIKHGMAIYLKKNSKNNIVNKTIEYTNRLECKCGASVNWIIECVSFYL